MLTALTAGVKEKKGADFLRINDNIQNKELRAELEGLRDEFKFERNRIHDYYKEKIEEIKESRGNEMRTIKKDFSELPPDFCYLNKFFLISIIFKMENSTIF